MLDPAFGAEFTKIIVILTVTACTLLVKKVLIKIMEIIARISSCHDGLRQYIKPAVSEPTFWVDNIIGFGPNGARQNTMARLKYWPHFIGSIIGYVILLGVSAFVTARFLGLQRLIAVKSSVGFASNTYNVSQWAYGTADGGMILGPVVYDPNENGYSATSASTPIAVLSNGEVVFLHMNVTHYDNQTEEIAVEYTILLGNDLMIGPNDGLNCKKIFDNFRAQLNKFDKIDMSQYGYYGNITRLGIVPPILKRWDDDIVGKQIESCLKDNVIFAFDINPLIIPMYALAGFVSLSLLVIAAIRFATSRGGSWSYYAGALGAKINTEPLNSELTICLWRSEACGNNDCAAPLADRDTRARLQLGYRGGDDTVLHYGMFKESKGAKEPFENLGFDNAIKMGDISYSITNPEKKAYIVAGSKSPES